MEGGGVMSKSDGERSKVPKMEGGGVMSKSVSDQEERLFQRDYIEVSEDRKEGK